MPSRDMVDLFGKAIAAAVKPDPQKAERLVNRQYTGTFKLWFGNDQYLGHGFIIVGPPAPEPGAPDNAIWVARYGQYNQYQGYWNYLPNANKCWQAVNANGPLRYWNDDGQASGPPEDWELFLFRNYDTGKAMRTMRTCSSLNDSSQRSDAESRNRLTSR
jgi:hypothetical protein